MSKPKTPGLFRNIIIAVVLFIPFIYSFFYLKAYWNPYGEGNIDNIPVAIVNEDEGGKGAQLVESIESSGKLKPETKTLEEADNCLKDTSCYAKIHIPKDFTASMESVATTDKKHATITYSPNQKSNFLASQIINSVVNAVEKSLDNQVDAAIIDKMADNIQQVPGALDTLSDGLGELHSGANRLSDGSKTLLDGTKTLADGTGVLEDGSKTLSDGLSELNTKYQEFGAGVKTAYDGSKVLNSGIGQLASSVSDIKTLVDSTAKLSVSYGQFDVGLLKYIDGVNRYMEIANNIFGAGAGNVEAALNKAKADGFDPVTSTAQLQTSGMLLGGSSTQLKSGIGQLAVGTQKLSTLSSGVSQLKSGSDSLTSGLNTLNTKSGEVQAGIAKLYDGSLVLKKGASDIANGSTTLNNGSKTLSSGLGVLSGSVLGAKTELDNKIANTRERLKVVDDLTKYAETPVTINNDVVNEVDSYGVSFAPLFISIGLWVGALMSFVVLYYDKQKRFGNLGVDGTHCVKRTFSYHLIATAAGFTLALLLQLFLDLHITNIALYYGSVILISNTFMAIMEFLIVNFGDVGKFLGLIILVLQLAAAGGTFPIETVSAEFRPLNGFLPMTYTVRLLKESLMSAENHLLVPNLIAVFGICVSFTAFNIIRSALKDKNK